jgi:hypothetical protein
VEKMLSDKACHEIITKESRVEKTIKVGQMKNY